MSERVIFDNGIERDPATNLLLSMTDALGRKTAHTYDVMGNSVATTWLAGTSQAVTVTRTYDSTYNRLASITNPLGQQTVFVYDAQGKLIQRKDGNGYITQYTNDAEGRVTQITDPLGETSTFTYDGADLVKRTDPLGRSVDLIPDSVGRTSAIVDAMGNQTAIAHDVIDHATRVTDPLGQSTEMSFDAMGNRIQVKDARGNLHGYIYDGRNYPVSYTDPIQQTTSYAYDSGHNLTGTTDRKGQVTHYNYDNLDRLTQVQYADGSTISYSYDLGSRITSVVDSINGTSTFNYDAWDRTTNVSMPNGSVAYTYFANGLRKTMTVAGQPTLSYTYDAGGRLVRIDQAAGIINNNTQQSVSFAYDAANRRTQTTLPTGITINYSYDDASQLTGIVYNKADGTQIGNLTYAYDAAGRRIRTGGSLAKAALPNDVSNASADAANRLTAWGGATLSYDANGNLTSDGTQSYVWNARNQLSQIKDASGNVIASFSYDALGRRQSKTVNGVVTSYAHDGANVVKVTDGAGVAVNYLTGLGMDELYAALTGSGSNAQITGYLTDALGSTIRLVNGAGEKLVDYTYEAYGAATSDAANTNLFQYTGRENDGTGLYYYRARYYSPALGRFISQDPLEMLAGTNFYTYVGGNPVRYVDPTGRNAIVLGGELGADVGTAIFPGVGTVVGGIIGAGAGWWLGDKIVDWAKNVIFNKPGKTPNTGDPGSCHVNPGSGQERKYGPDGRPEYDIDWDHDHGQGVPHGHNWEDGVRGPGLPISPVPEGRGPSKE